MYNGERSATPEMVLEMLGMVDQAFSKVNFQPLGRLAKMWQTNKPQLDISTATELQIEPEDCLTA